MADIAGWSRREFLGAAGASAAGLATLHAQSHLVVAQAQQPSAGAKETPIGPRWWPSPWGADDEKGASNRITPQRVLEATRLIRQGKVYRIGRVYEAGMPLFGSRHYSLTIPGRPTGGPFGVGHNMLVYNDEMFSGEIGQVGTQFDGLGHIGTRIGAEDVFYNGFKLSEFGDAYGLKKLGIEKLNPYFTRGLLVDLVGLKGRDLTVGEVVTVADIQAALRRQGGLTIGEGDVVLFRTGHGKLWMKDNATYNSGEGGIGATAARWLAAQRICIAGADNWAVEAVPGESRDEPFLAHQELINRNGICLHENLDLEGLAADRVWEFAYIFTPVPFKGATGSPGSPIAVV
jgi:kynurenine formamidase